MAGNKKPASLTGNLLARKGQASAAGFDELPFDLEEAERAEGGPAAVSPSVAAAVPVVAPPPDQDSDPDFAALARYTPAPDRQLQRPRRPRAKQTILIVEDNPLDMKLFRDLLEIQGYATVQARNGKEALTYARQHRPDLIVMDMDLPDISGLELTRRFRADAELRTFPIVVVTAFVTGGNEAEIRDAGCDAYIAKPISVSGFLHTCARVCRAAEEASTAPGSTQKA